MAPTLGARDTNVNILVIKPTLTTNSCVYKLTCAPSHTYGEAQPPAWTNTSAVFRPRKSEGTRGVRKAEPVVDIATSTIRRVAVVGGGAAGSFCARLLAREHPNWQVVLFERLPPDRTFGFGVGLTGALLDAVRATDTDVYDDILDASIRSSSASFRLPAGTVTLSGFHHGVSIGRAELLRLLLARAEQAGVDTHVGTSADAIALSREFDLVVAADGVASRTRQELTTQLGASVEYGRGLFIWCGSETELPGATFMPVRTEHGVFVVHAYPYAPGRSTWVVETDTEALDRAGLNGFDANAGMPGATDQRSLTYLAAAFADMLEGHQLIGNASRWAHFRTVHCRNWSYGNVALIGDAAATAHPSLGSGTKLALEAAIALAESLRDSGTTGMLSDALQAYERNRRGIVERLQRRARQSRLWWESFPARMHMNPARVALSFMSRGGAVGLEDLHRTDPELVREALADYASTGHNDVPHGVPVDWILQQMPIELQNTLDTRVVEDLGNIEVLSTLEVDCDDAWGPDTAPMMDTVRHAIDTGRAGAVVLTGGDKRDQLLHRLAFAERLGLELGATVVVCLAGSGLPDGVDALVANRVDLLHITDQQGGGAAGATAVGTDLPHPENNDLGTTIHRWRDEVTGFPDEMGRHYRAEHVWGSRTIAQELHARAQSTPNALAVAGPDRQLSYAELDEATDRIGAGFIDLGFQPGDTILLQIDNSVSAVLTWYGILKAALIPVATLSIHRGNEIRQVAAQTRASGHIVALRDRDFDLVEFARRLSAETQPRRRVLTLTGDDDQSVVNLGSGMDPQRARHLVEVAQAEIRPDDVAVFQLSGGTTGTPKVIPRAHAGYWYNARAYADRLQWDSSVRTLHAAPLVHNAGIVCALHAAHSVGGAFVVGTPKTEAILTAMVEYAATDGLMMPGMAAELLDHPLFDAATSSMRRIVLSGSSIPDRVFDAFESRGVRVAGLFGMGEGLCMMTPLDAPRHIRQHSVGHPLSELDEVRIVVPGTEIDVEDSEAGEFCARGPYTLRGYLAAPERNAAVFTSDGYYRSGDLLARHQSDFGTYYTFEGRAKDLVNRGGEKINSAEIEGLVLSIPTVLRAALIPLPDERLGERACLCVELADGNDDFGLDDVRAHLDDLEVAKYKWPERLERFDTLPTTAVGKVDKRRLRELVAHPTDSSPTQQAGGRTQSDHPATPRGAQQ